MDHALYFVDEAVGLATFGSIMIAVWRGAPTRDRLDIAFALVIEHSKATGGAVGAVVVVEDGAPPPTPEDLVFLTERFDRVLGTVVAAVAAAFEVRGEAAELRSSAESLGGHLGLRIPTKMCFAQEEACAWIVPRLVADADPSYRVALAEAVEQTRRRIGER